MATAGENAPRLTAEDRLEIRELIAEYSYCEDHGESERWADLFTSDGGFTRGTGEVVSGREALVKFSVDRWANNTKVHRWTHWVDNITMTPTADGADSYSYTKVIEKSDNGFQVIQVAAKNDKLRRENGKWRFQSRVVVPLSE